MEGSYCGRVGNLHSYDCQGVKLLSQEKIDGSRINVAIRPENIFLSKKDENTENSLELTLEKIEIKGTEVELLVEKGDFKLSLNINKNVLDYHQLKTHDKIFAHIKAENVHIIKS